MLPPHQSEHNHRSDGTKTTRQRRMSKAARTFCQGANNVLRSDSTATHRLPSKPLLSTRGALCSINIQIAG
eukprot:6061-Heterococcus_DN1.PRE.6